LKIQEGGGRRLGFWKMSIAPNWIESYLRKIWWADASRHAQMTHDQTSKPELFLGDVIIIMHKDVYIERMSGT